MSNEEAVEYLEEIWELLFKEIRGRVFDELKNTGELDKFKNALDTAVAALSNKPCENVLDTIKEEIMSLDYNLDYMDYDYDDMVQTAEIHMVCREEVLLVIDQYKSKK